MKIKKNDSISSKIQKLIHYNKQYLIKHGIIQSFIYLFDKTGMFHSLNIDSSLLLNDLDYKQILKSIVKDEIEKLEITNNTKIIKILFIYEYYFDTAIDLNNLDEDYSENIDSDLQFTVYEEDKFNIKIQMHQCIQFKEDNNRYIVVSENPSIINTYCKIDPNNDLKGTLTNILT